MEKLPTIEEKPNKFDSKKDFLKYLRRITLASVLALSSAGSVQAQDKFGTIETAAGHAELLSINKEQGVEFEKKLHEVDSLVKILVQKIDEKHLGKVEKSAGHYKTTNINYDGFEISAENDSYKVGGDIANTDRLEVFKDHKGFFMSETTYENENRKSYDASFFPKSEGGDKFIAYQSAIMSDGSDDPYFESYKNVTYKDFQNGLDELSKELQAEINKIP